MDAVRNQWTVIRYVGIASIALSFYGILFSNRTGESLILLNEKIPPNSRFPVPGWMCPGNLGFDVGPLPASKECCIDFKTSKEWSTLRNFRHGRTISWPAGRKDPIRPLPDFVWRGYADEPPYAFIPYGNVPPAYSSTVWLRYCDQVENWTLMVGNTNFAQPLTNATNSNYCLEWAPGIYFSYER